MHNKRLSKTPSSIFSNSQAAQQNPKLAYRPFGSQIQKASVAPVTQSTKEDVAFAEQKMEAFGLELQAKYGKITPEGQERLTVLQAKMDGLLNSRLEHATRFGHNIANIPLRRPDTPIQAKLTIGEPGDKYEQEADETARQVVQSIHQPQSEKLQREELPEEDELQMKPLGNIQRESLPDEEDELQMKPMVQRVSDGGMAATQDLEASINQARGGGQPLANNIREPMELGFGADFSRVKVHTDTQADQLNRSIQAKAFTTGQDVFFRQGAYEPGSRGGQELLAHELTHIVQQNSNLQIFNDSGIIQAVFGDRFRKPWNREAKNIKPEDVAGSQWGNYFMSQKGKKRQTDAYKKFKDDYHLDRNDHTTAEIFNALIDKSRSGYYLTGGTTSAKVSMATGVWNCESLAAALNEIVDDIGAENVGHLVTINTRKLSRRDVKPEMDCFRKGNVVAESGFRRTSFSTHTWAVINGTPYDPLMGEFGGRVANIWEYDVTNNQVEISGVNYRYEQLDEKEGPIHKARLIAIPQPISQG